MTARHPRPSTVLSVLNSSRLASRRPPCVPSHLTSSAITTTRGTTKTSTVDSPRTFSTSTTNKKDDKKPTKSQGSGTGKPPPHRYNYNTSLSWDEEPDPEHVRYRRVTAKDLAYRRDPPKKVKMLVRDFVDDSLYNPNYGYFAKQATIFTSNPPASSSSSSSSSSPHTSPSSNPEPSSVGFKIPSYPNLTAFQEDVAERYDQTYGEIVLEDAESGVGEVRGGKGGLGRQVWHTPTELFRPHYSRIIAKSLLTHYKLHHWPYNDFILYEIGAGNGSLMVDIMTYLREEHPEVYECTKYTIVEISEALAEGQRKRVKENGLEGRVVVENKDFFDWQGGGKDPCYFVALEVFDNFAHDMIRYDMKTMTPLQAVVCIDGSGDFSLMYEQVTDPLIRRYLGYRRHVNYPYSPTSLSSLWKSSSNPLPLNPLLASSPILRKLYNSLPFAPNLSPPEFLPTKQMVFLERLRDQLPGHRLLISDFDALPDAVEGKNGPVVQTRYGGDMVPCETFLVKQGYFDIFFPTDFEMLKEIYSVIMTTPASRRLSPGYFSPQQQQSNPSGSSSASSDLMGTSGFKHRHVAVYSHAEFLQGFGDESSISGTTTKDRTNVMLSMYKNAKFMF